MAAPRHRGYRAMLSEEMVGCLKKAFRAYATTVDTLDAQGKLCVVTLEQDRQARQRALQDEKAGRKRPAAAAAKKQQNKKPQQQQQQRRFAMDELDLARFLWATTGEQLARHHVDIRRSRLVWGTCELLREYGVASACTGGVCMTLGGFLALYRSLALKDSAAVVQDMVAVGALSAKRQGPMKVLVAVPARVRARAPTGATVAHLVSKQQQEQQELKTATSSLEETKEEFPALPSSTRPQTPAVVEQAKATCEPQQQQQQQQQQQPLVATPPAPSAKEGLGVEKPQDKQRRMLVGNLPEVWYLALMDEMNNAKVTGSTAGVDAVLRAAERVLDAAPAV